LAKSHPVIPFKKNKLQMNICSSIAVNVKYREHMQLDSESLKDRVVLRDKWQRFQVHPIPQESNFNVNKWYYNNHELFPVIYSLF
jgi:hypothetical protein